MNMLKNPLLLIYLVLVSMAFALTGCVSISQSAVDLQILETTTSHTVRVIQISDAHFSREKKLFENMVSLVNELSPDVIVFSGDQAVSKESITVMQKYMSEITVACPKLAINGNWEYIKEIPFDEYKQAIKDAGFMLLENEQYNLDIDGKKLSLYGLDDYLGGNPSFENFVPHSGAVTVFLAHCPPLFDIALHEITVPFCMLCGHTHGGQFVFGGKAVYFPRGTGSYYAGNYYSGANHLYVSTGLGNSSRDIRNVPPVIEVISFIYDGNNQFVSMSAQAVKVSAK